MADVVDHPLSHHELSQFRQRPRRERQIMIGRPRQATFLISRRCGSVNVGGRPPAYFGASESHPSALKLWITYRTRSSEVNALFAIAGTSIRCVSTRPPPAHHRARTPPHDRQQLAALVVGQIPNLHPFSHAPSLRDHAPSGGRDTTNVPGHGTRRFLLSDVAAKPGAQRSRGARSGPEPCGERTQRPFRRFAFARRPRQDRVSPKVPLEEIANVA